MSIKSSQCLNVYNYIKYIIVKVHKRKLKKYYRHETRGQFFDYVLKKRSPLLFYTNKRKSDTLFTTQKIT